MTVEQALQVLRGFEEGLWDENVAEKEELMKAVSVVIKALDNKIQTAIRKKEAEQEAAGGEEN